MGQENDGAERCNKQGRKFKHDTNLTTDLRPVTLLKAQRFRLISARQENGFVARPLARPEDRGTVFRTRTTTIGLAVAEPRSAANHVAALVAPVPIEEQPGQARPQRATQQCPPNNDLDSERLWLPLPVFLPATPTFEGGFRSHAPHAQPLRWYSR